MLVVRKWTPSTLTKEEAGLTTSLPIPSEVGATVDPASEPKKAESRASAPRKNPKPQDLPRYEDEMH